eukprot:SAG22_NODE_4917_length_1133_cov_1.596712_2_plen_128_part_00
MCGRASASPGPRLGRLLKYKPNSWWFEMPLLAYKLVVILASELLSSGSPSNTRTLLVLLGVYAIFMVGLVAMKRPFRGASRDNTGFSGADISEVIGMSAAICQYSVHHRLAVLENHQRMRPVRLRMP